MMLFKKKKSEQQKSEPKAQPRQEKQAKKVDASVRPGGVFMVQLLMKEPCETPSIERMTEVLTRHIGRVEAAKPSDQMAGSMNGIALFAAMEHIGRFQDAQGPIQVSIMPCETFHPEKIDEMKRSQMWDVQNNRDRILSECKYCSVSVQGATRPKSPDLCPSVVTFAPRTPCTRRSSA